MTTTDLDEKLKRLFPQEVVNKRLARLGEAARLPRFIAESAFKRICGDNPTPQDLAKLSEFVRTYYPEPKEKDRLLHELMRRGEHRLLDEFKVSVDIKRGTYRAEIPSLRIYDARINPWVLEEHRALLEAGMWGVATLKYQPDQAEDQEHTPVYIVDFKPIQYSGVDLEEFKDKRRMFTTGEWVDILVNTVGLNPAAYTPRGKLLLLSRLIPFVEQNVNMFELGPRATGKSYLYKNISYYARVYSGGRVSPATLFFHGSYRVMGDVGVRDVVVFDEIGRVDFANPDEMVGKLKDYMESGEFERGALRRARSGCSLVFMGNIEVEGDRPAENPTDILPRSMRDSALVDRINGFIPGWELPKILQSEAHLSFGYGFIADYFCEIMHELRKEDFQQHIVGRVELSGEPHPLTIRDEKSIRKVVSALLKILCPHGEYTERELETCVGLAVEYRQRVHDWLCELSPGEFKPKTIKYRIRGC